ncbi:hypothetical protein PR048_004320 [Dryococelus australis]|uniref:E3 ubiquitin-protein ligase n=1 Tax=Dryococelus australis TaxID=614101 RepID=A0ABQ9I540_9NEOP|nr:hypothetical protein PR048_004320 [Dryococelus australis]
MDQSKISTENLESFNDTLLTLLECPICTEFMSPPIFQCKNGHKLCAECKPLLTECPSCKEKNLDSRNFVAEELAEKLMYPCVNVDAGCQIKIQLNSMAKHSAVCPHRLHNCLESSCKWQGRTQEMLEHLKGTHNMAWMTAANPHLYYDNFDLSTDFEEHDAIDAFEELFLFHFKRDATKRRLFVAVQYVGSEEAAMNYRYQVFILSADGAKWVDFVSSTHKDTVSFEEIMNSKKCLCVDFEVIEDLLDTDLNLKFKINLSDLKNSAIINTDM